MSLPRARCKGAGGDRNNAASSACEYRILRRRSAEVDKLGTFGNEVIVHDKHERLAEAAGSACN
jgi:hypothetical protein